MLWEAILRVAESGSIVDIRRASTVPGTYSPIVEVSVASPGAAIRAYPNPATSGTSLLFRSDDTVSYIIRVTDGSGKFVMQIAGTSTRGLNKIDLDVHSLAAGTYTLTLTDEEHDRRSIQLLKE